MYCYERLWAIVIHKRGAAPGSEPAVAAAQQEPLGAKRLRDALRRLGQSVD